MNNRITSFKGRYAYLSNFFYAPINYEGLTYRSSEGAYQAAKCKNLEERAWFQFLNSIEAKRMGKTIEIREDWDDVKLGVMEDINRIKFSQYAGLRQLLLGTKNKVLEEGNTWGDRYWGTVNGVGENHLGKILMKLREEFRGGHG